MYDEFKLNNGLRAIAERITHFRSVSVGIWIGAGSMYEQPQENGYAHFLEHMLFKGTHKRSARKIAQEMDSIGGQMNAFTAKECTCYYAKVMDEHLDKAMDLLSDLILNAKLDPADMERERGVILEEIALTEDTPEDLVHDLLSAAHFSGQALSMPVLGTAKIIRGAAADDLRAFRAAHYRPGNTVLSVAGNFDPARLRELAEQYLGPWPQGEGPCAPLSTGAYEPGAQCQEKDIEQTHICLGYPGIPLGSPDIFALSILNNLLGGGMSSRLFQKIREELGIAYAVGCFPAMYPGTGLFTVYAGTSPDNAPLALEQIGAEIRKFLELGVSAEEFSRGREQLKGGYILGLESATSRMSAIGRRKLLQNRALTEDEVLSRIAAVTRDDIMRVAGDILSKPRSIALVGRNVNELDKFKR